jgi:hypothetical protein
LALSVAALAGCGDDEAGPGPVSSGVVSTKINGNEADIENDTIYKATNINTTGNTWGDFVNRATGECGADPAAFELTALTVSNPTPFEGFVSGELAIVFTHMTSSDVPQDPKATAGTVSAPKGTGPIALGALAGRDALAPLHNRLLQTFEVVLRAKTDKTDKDDFTFDIKVEIQANALCE